MSLLKDGKMFLTACCHACNPFYHLLRFRSFDEPPEFAPKMLSKLLFIIPNAASIILDLEKGSGKHKKPLCLSKYGRQFTVEFLLYKLWTWQICMGLRSQTTSAIMTNYWRSSGYTSPVRIGLLSTGKSCIPSIHKLSLTRVTLY